MKKPQKFPPDGVNTRGGGEERAAGVAAAEGGKGTVGEPTTPGEKGERALKMLVGNMEDEGDAAAGAGADAGTDGEGGGGDRSVSVAGGG